MARTEFEGKFDDLCQKYTHWIIQYNSSSIQFPIFMVWLTDSSDNAKDKFIIDRKNKIIGSTTLIGLLDVVKRLDINVPDVANTKKWIKKSLKAKLYPCSTYDVNLVRSSLHNKCFDSYVLEEAAKFINLYGDFAEQLDDKKLLKLMKNNSIKDLWEFYYDWVFWPRFNNKKKFEKLKTPPFRGDFKVLTVEFNRLIDEFEKRIIIVR